MGGLLSFVAPDFIQNIYIIDFIRINPDFADSLHTVERICGNIKKTA
jgi:hypothetical protein